MTLIYLKPVCTWLPVLLPTPARPDSFSCFLERPLFPSGTLKKESTTTVAFSSQQLVQLYVLLLLHCDFRTHRKTIAKCEEVLGGSTLGRRIYYWYKIPRSSSCRLFLKQIMQHNIYPRIQFWHISAHKGDGSLQYRKEQREYGQKWSQKCQKWKSGSCVRPPFKGNTELILAQKMAFTIGWVGYWLHYREHKSREILEKYFWADHSLRIAKWFSNLERTLVYVYSKSV